MTTPYYQAGPVTVFHGDCIEVMRGLPDASVDAVATDPPYGIRFMGKEWDGADIVKRAESALRKRTRRDGRSQRADYSLAMSAGTYDFSGSANQAFQEWCTLWAGECLRVLKPGGHLLAFGGSRTWHRLASGIEDAGFEIRDSIAWLYGSGFPKSLDVAKAIDKAAGHWRGKAGEVVTDNGGEFVRGKILGPHGDVHAAVTVDGFCALLLLGEALR